MFAGWMKVEEACGNCGLVFEPSEGNSWWFMYFTTAFVTGLVIIGMLLLPPANIWVGRSVVLVVSLGLYFVSFPFRKGLALAIDYLTEPERPGRQELPEERRGPERKLHRD